MIIYIMLQTASVSFLFFFNDTATTEIYTLSLHDALPISFQRGCLLRPLNRIRNLVEALPSDCIRSLQNRSEEHTSELQSQSNLVCRLLLEKKKKILLIRISFATDLYDAAAPAPVYFWISA